MVAKNYSRSQMMLIILVSALTFTGGATTASAGTRDCNCCPPGYRHAPSQPSAPQYQPGVPSYSEAPQYPSAPEYPSAPQYDGQLVPPQTSADPQQFDPGLAGDPAGAAPLPSFDLSAGLATNFGAGGVSSLAFADQGGYLDSPIVRNQLRMRMDASYDNPTPDRAEFFYPQCGCFPGGAGPQGIPNPSPETGVDYQEFSLYAESLIYRDVVSAFVELPFRLINPEVNDNTGGASDINLGFRAALLANRCRTLTFQFRTFVPTGEGRRGLGTEHYSIEPALLWMQRYRGGTVIQGELRDWIPIDGSEDLDGEFSGNVLRYGLGISQTWFDDGRLTVHPVFEAVGWSVLGGQVLSVTSPNFRESAETTIANIKFGTRFNLSGRCCGDPARSLYVGYGRAVTGPRWYQDTIRAEYRIAY